MSELYSRKALVARGAILGYLQPRLAADARFDPAAALGDVNARNFRLKIPAIVSRVKAATTGKLARDASPEELQKLLETLEGEEGSDDGIIGSTIGALSTTHPDPARDQEEPAPLNLSSQQVDELLEFCARLMSPDDLQQLSELLVRHNQPGAVDEPPPFPGRPRPGGTMDPITSDASISRRARVLAADARSRVASDAAASFAKLFPNAAPIKSLPVLAQDARPTRTTRMRSGAGADDDYARMFPDAAKLRIL